MGTHVDTTFLQIFIWEQFGTISPKPTQSYAIEMIEIEVDGEIIEKLDKQHNLEF